MRSMRTEGKAPIRYGIALKLDRSAATGWQTYFAHRYESYYPEAESRRWEILQHLTQRVEAWQLSQRRLVRHLQYYEQFEIFLSLETTKEKLDEKDALMSAIYKRSNAEFSDYVQCANPQNLMVTLQDSRFGIPLALWCDGLNTLLSHFKTENYGDCISSLMKWAMTCSEPKSVQLLLRHGVVPTFQDLCRLLHFINLSLESQYKTYGPTFLECVRAFQHKNVEPVSLANVTDVSEPQSAPHQKPNSSGTYSIYNMSLFSAKLLWDAGYHDVNSVDEHSFDANLNGTPLWSHLANSYARFMYADLWLVVEWFLEKGATVDWMHPRKLTTPAHLLGRRLTYWRPGLDHLCKLEYLLTASHTDNCTCHCSISQSGCRVIGCIVHNIWVRSNAYSLLGIGESVAYKELIRSYVYTLIDTHKSSKWMSSSALRVLTFDELSLTHTCCVDLSNETEKWGSPLTKEETREIHEIEHKDIELLDMLTKEFESKWHTYTGTFAQFIKKVWKPRMKAIRNQQKDTREIFREVGVELLPCEDESTSESEADEVEDNEDSSNSEAEDSWHDANDNNEHLKSI
ncbi:hypothetical protein GQ44DRAFT_269406 [Phaeosphaeriaceae sp. PMI808]|nr:hypothetical protein GQ44DRAFT_269406 [Phaeosphaeriaceae sp. PMI808]